MNNEDQIIEIPEQLLYDLLRLVVHKKDCDIIQYYGLYNPCTCKVSKTLCDARELLVTKKFNNNDTFGGTSAPAWLTEMVERKYKPYKPRSYKPGPMSDG